MWLLADLAAGLVAGFAFASLLSRSRAAAAAAAAAAEARAAAAADLSRAREEVAALKAHGERIPRIEAELKARDAELAAVRGQLVQLRTREEALREQIAELKAIEDALKKSFKSLSDEALIANNEAFLKLAQEKLGTVQKLGEKDLAERQKAIVELTRPLSESIQSVEKYVRDVEKERVNAYSSLLEQVKALGEGQGRLQQETASLVRSLRVPASRGRWGEQTLRRVVELAGMQEYCDFFEQETVTGEDGRLRPDMVVRLPSGRVIVVDSKVPLDAFLDAQELDDDAAREAKLIEHAAKVRGHMRSLSQKSYWEQFEGSAELVIMFLPTEGIFSAALRYDGQLIEFGAEARVLPSSPITLIALLRSVAFGWRQEKVAENAQKISEQGRDLYDRLVTWMRHLASLGKGLQAAIDAYDESIGSLERRVLPKAREFEALGAATTKEIPDLPPLERKVRQIQAEEVRALPQASQPNGSASTSPDPAREPAEKNTLF